MRVEGERRRSMVATFVLEVRANGDELLVSHREALMLELDGIDLSNPDLLDQVAPMQAIRSYTPGYFVTLDGAFARVEPVDEARLETLHPELAAGVREYFYGYGLLKTLPFVHDWEWRALVGAWRDWTVAKGETKLVAGDAAHGRARLEHLGELQGGIRLQRTESIESGPWTVTIRGQVMAMLYAAGVERDKLEARAQPALDGATMEIIYSVLTEPDRLRPWVAMYIITQRFEVDGVPGEMMESRTYELDWAAAEGCGK